MDANYAISKKRHTGIADKLRWLILPDDKKSKHYLNEYIGYVKIPGLNHGQGIFINKGVITTDIDF